MNARMNLSPTEAFLNMRRNGYVPDWLFVSLAGYTQIPSECFALAIDCICNDWRFAVGLNVILAVNEQSQGVKKAAEEILWLNAHAWETYERHNAPTLLLWDVQKHVGRYLEPMWHNPEAERAEYDRDYAALQWDQSNRGWMNKRFPRWKNRSRWVLKIAHVRPNETQKETLQKWLQ